MGIGCLQQARLANESRVELPASVPSRVGGEGWFDSSVIRDGLAGSTPATANNP